MARKYKPISGVVILLYNYGAVLLAALWSFFPADNLRKRALQWALADPAILAPPSKPTLKQKAVLFAKITFAKWGTASARAKGSHGGKLMHCQPQLARLPVPPINQTIDKFIMSVERVIPPSASHSPKAAHGPSAFEALAASAREFQQSKVAAELQNVLRQRALDRPNWLNDWWEEFIYLRSREPIAIFSNVFAADKAVCPTTDPCLRAAGALYSLFEWRRKIVDGSLNPDFLEPMPIPLCSRQYERLFNDCDEVTLYGDSIEKAIQNSHVAVCYRNHWFVLHLIDSKKNILPPDVIAEQLHIGRSAIQSRKDNAVALSLLTTYKRNDWAALRERIIGLSEHNRKNVELIESSMIALCFEDDSPLDAQENLLCGAFGSGNSRWFDKSLTMIISANGRMSWNAEHACSDAIVMGRMIDYIYSHEQPPAQRADYTSFSSKLSAPISLMQFAVDDVITKSLKEAPAYALALKSSADIRVKASPFGKGIMKKLGVSPDGFIQMALQLAWANEQHGRQHIFPNTYESATTRFFLNGRTETIRSATPDSCQFVDASRDKTENPTDAVTKGKLLRKAIRTHVDNAKAAGRGEGFDRHLFGLMMAALENRKKVPFLENPLLKLQFSLSTSQTACKLSMAGGFGPVFPCGYGVSYFVQEDHIMFTVSCFADNPNTNSARYLECIIAAMQLQRELLAAK